MEHRSRAVRALVHLHERSLRSFLATWKEAKAKNVSLPGTDDPDYRSLETLLFHVVRCARGYVIWICEKLELPSPEIRSSPSGETLEAEVDAYVEHLLAQWRTALLRVEDATLDSVQAESRWGVVYSIDAMLEHAVMHPIRHRFQIEEWLSGRP